MVSKVITKEFITEVCKDMKMFDITGELPNERVRIDITLSREALGKLEGNNRSKVIENLILNS